MSMFAEQSAYEKAAINAVSDQLEALSTVFKAQLATDSAALRSIVLIQSFRTGTRSPSRSRDFRLHFEQFAEFEAAEAYLDRIFCQDAEDSKTPAYLEDRSFWARYAPRWSTTQSRSRR